MAQFGESRARVVQDASTAGVRTQAFSLKGASLPPIRGRQAYIVGSVHVNMGKYPTGRFTSVYPAGSPNIGSARVYQYETYVPFHSSRKFSILIYDQLMSANYGSYFKPKTNGRKNKVHKRRKSGLHLQANSCHLPKTGTFNSLLLLEQLPRPPSYPARDRKLCT